MTILRVYPNPYAAFDKNGVPCGVCPRDPADGGGGIGQYVGARLDRKRTTMVSDVPKGETLLKSRHERVYEYMGIAAIDPQLASKLGDAEPVELQKSPYYRSRLIARELLPADKETAALAGVPYMDPKVVLDKLAGEPSEGLQQLQAHHFPDAEEPEAKPARGSAYRYPDARKSDPESA